MRLPHLLLLAFALLITACTADQSVDATLDTTPMTGTSTTTTMSDSTTTPEPTTTTTLESDSFRLDASCSSPVGFTVSYPESWETNEGGVVPECTMFDPEGFALPDGTDERVAAITFYIAHVDYEEATSIDRDLVRDREIRSIDGRRAVRVESVAGEGNLVPEGTSITRYYIDLGVEEGETGRVLVADTIDYTSIDYEQSQEVLDGMVPTLAVDPAATAGADAVDGYSAPPIESSGFPSSGDPALLTDVRFGVHDGFERVVFEFGNDADISYSVEYVEEAIPASGDPIAVDGGHILDVTIAPASGMDLEGGETTETYTGPDRVAVPGELVSELVQVEDFESVLTWAVGLERAANVAVDTLPDPLRLVLDISTG